MDSGIANYNGLVGNTTRQKGYDLPGGLLPPVEFNGLNDMPNDCTSLEACNQGFIPE